MVAWLRIWITSGFGSISSIQSTLPRAARTDSIFSAISRAISGVSGAPAQRMSCASGSIAGAASRRWVEPLLPRDPADEDNRGTGGVDPVAFEHVHPTIGPVLGCVDAVVDHARARGVDRRDSTRGSRAGAQPRRRRSRRRPRAPSAPRSPTARNHRRAARASTGASARGCAPSRRAGSSGRALPGGRQGSRTRCGCGRARHRPRPPPSSSRSRTPAAPPRRARGRRARPMAGMRRRRPAGTGGRSAPQQCTVTSAARASSRARYSTWTPAPP